MASTNRRYRVERMPNGLYRIYDRRCKWAGLYRADGSFYCGQAQLNEAVARDLIKQHKGT